MTVCTRELSSAYTHRSLLSVLRRLEVVSVPQLPTVDKEWLTGCDCLHTPVAEAAGLCPDELELAVACGGVVQPPDMLQLVNSLEL